MYLPLEKQKPCIHVMSQWEDRTYRMYNSNMLDNIARLFVCSHASAQSETSVFQECRLSLNIHPVKRSILFQEEGVATVTGLHKKSDPGAASRLKMVLKDLHMDARFLNYCNCRHIKMTEVVKVPL